jgi:hypothetical protein
LAISVAAQLSGGGPAKDSTAMARDAVAAFYAWYAPFTTRTSDADMHALRTPRWRFGPVLATALRADRAASAASPGEIVGLDMDPFLNTQDPCKRYAPVAARRAGANFFVDVLGSGGCSRHTKPDVTVRLVFQQGKPVFINFIYSGKPGDDLLHLLAALAAVRAKTKPPA